MQGVVEYFRSRSLFDNSAGVHYYDVISHFGNNAEIVRNQKYRTVYSLFKIVEKVEYLSLNGNVECGGRFVRYYKTGFAGKRHGYHYSLSHTAGKLVRVGSVNSFGHRNSYGVEHVYRTLLGEFFCRSRNMKKGYFVELVAYREYGVQTRHRFLEDHRHLSAAKSVHFFNRHFGDIVNFFLSFVNLFAVFVHAGRYGIAVNVANVFVCFESYRAAYDLTGRSLQEAHNGHRSNGLTATRFAYDADGGIKWNFERNAVYRFYYALICKEVRVEILDFENVVVVLHRRGVFRFCFFAPFRDGAFPWRWLWQSLLVPYL